jgi:hypothetical protein
MKSFKGRLHSVRMAGKRLRETAVVLNAERILDESTLVLCAPVTASVEPIGRDKFLPSLAPRQHRLSQLSRQDVL